MSDYGDRYQETLDALNGNVGRRVVGKSPNLALGYGSDLRAVCTCAKCLYERFPTARIVAAEENHHDKTQFWSPSDPHLYWRLKKEAIRANPRPHIIVAGIYIASTVFGLTGILMLIAVLIKLALKALH